MKRTDKNVENKVPESVSLDKLATAVSTTIQDQKNEKEPELETAVKQIKTLLPDKNALKMIKIYEDKPNFI